MRLGIIGGGVTGKAQARCYLEFVDEVCVYDEMRERSTHSTDAVLKCDVIFLCVPEGRLNDLCRVLFGRDLNLVIRSTVPVGTTRRLRNECELPNLVHSPEFLTARCADTDVQIPARHLIGCPGALSEGVKRVTALYERRFPGVPVHVTPSEYSELAKLAVNAFFATKVAFFNEVRAYADTLDLNWEELVGLILSDGRISPYHFRVPGPDGKRGFSGSCLPKDLDTLMDCMLRAGVTPCVQQGVASRNRSDRGK